MSGRTSPGAYRRRGCAGFSAKRRGIRAGADVYCGRAKAKTEILDEIASDLGANVVALGHTADDFCESLLRNTLYTGRLSALPAVTYSRSGDFRIIRPLVYVSEEVTSSYADQRAMPITPGACSQRTGTVRRSLREFLAETKKDHPHVLENILSAMSRIDTPRLLDRRFLDFDQGGPLPSAETPELLPVLTKGD